MCLHLNLDLDAKNFANGKVSSSSKALPMGHSASWHRLEAADEHFPHAALDFLIPTTTLQCSHISS